LGGLERFPSWRWKMELPYAMKERSPDRAAAEGLAGQMDAIRRVMMERERATTSS